ncbi:MAG TPA: M13 family metallopeptidase [Pyrinomonadaceae bacterium]|jgi:endothelin-converting enzyme/putative endopeptidase|nr:M13 family metallopeptidase [Pyrinomonadaceae bacterium]
MAIFRILLALLLLTSTVFLQTRGVDLSDMDTGVKACDNFYDYANGTWRKNNPIPSSMPRWSRRWQAGEKAKDRLREILEEVSAKGPYKPASIDQIVSDFYKTCTDVDLANKNGVAPIKPMLAEIDSAKGKADIERIIAEQALIGMPSPFGFFGGQDNHDPANVIAQVTAGGLGLPDRDYYTKSEPRFAEAREKYKAHVTKMFTLAGSYDESAAAASAKIFSFETDLANASLDNVALRDPAATDHKMTFAELQKLTPAFDWATFYKRVGVKPTALNVSEPEFLKQFNKMLTSTSIADWQAYLKWRVINTASDTLSMPLVEANYAFYNAYLYGSKEMKPRATRCAESSDNLLGEAVGKKYVEKYFPPEAKARMTELVKNEIAAMGEIIKGLEWMSAETKQKALEKLATLKPKIGYPDKWRDYSSVSIGRSSHAANVEAAVKFAVRDNFGQIGKPVDRERWGMTPATSDAQYNPQLNDITFPAGILQPPAFFLDASDPINYGAIGVVIGHEISHGYDDQGAQYDAQGKLNNWWGKDDLTKFQAKVACVASQFEGYFIEPGMHHNGKLVLGESIADLAGAKIAYTALKIAERNKTLPTIDGFTPDQQFFIAWGQFRGDATRPETQRMMIQGDPHPIAKFRVIGPLSNLVVFQKTFGCSDGSAMVRPAAERCEVW